jgi:DNA-binding NtrC family response regulator
MSKALTSVLVVDDEPLVRILTVQVLEQAGFQVEEAASAQDALNHIDGHAIDALVTDIQMPGKMDGCGLAWCFHAMFPNAALLVISGVTKPEAEELPPRSRFLGKPLDPQRLVREVNEAISERRPT